MLDADFVNFTLCPAVLGIIVLTLTLLGFFEGQGPNQPRFRTKRFIGTIIFTFLAMSLVDLAGVPRIRELILSSRQKAYEAVAQSRARRSYALDNYAAFFPDSVGKDKDCLRAAISNYVEDEWNITFHEGLETRNPDFCKKNASVCVTKQDDYYEALRNTFNPHHFLYQDIKITELVLNSDWIAAQGSYRLMRQLTRQIDAEGNIPQEADTKTIENYRGYFSRCQSLYPVYWVNTEKPLARPYPSFCLGTCP